MKITGTKDETAWAFRALEVAGICEGCQARVACNASEDVEEAKGTPIERRPTCGDMLRQAIKTR